MKFNIWWEPLIESQLSRIVVIVDHCDDGETIVDGNIWTQGENVDGVKETKNERGKIRNFSWLVDDNILSVQKRDLVQKNLEGEKREKKRK